MAGNVVKVNKMNKASWPVELFNTGIVLWKYTLSNWTNSRDESPNLDCYYHKSGVYWREQIVLSLTIQDVTALVSIFLYNFLESFLEVFLKFWKSYPMTNALKTF